MLCLSGFELYSRWVPLTVGFELYSRWVPLTVYHLQKVSRNSKCSWKYHIYSIKSPLKQMLHLIKRMWRLLEDNKKNFATTW